jgi:hypothetical protein
LTTLPQIEGASESNGGIKDAQRQGAFLERALAWCARHGIIIEWIMTHNGGAYLSYDLYNACAHRRTKRYTPRTNRKF